jgi:hypothetical protein
MRRGRVRRRVGAEEPRPSRVSGGLRPVHPRGVSASVVLYQPSKAPQSTSRTIKSTLRGPLPQQGSAARGIPGWETRLQPAAPPLLRPCRRSEATGISGHLHTVDVVAASPLTRRRLAPARRFHTSAQGSGQYLRRPHHASHASRWGRSRRRRRVGLEPSDSCSLWPMICSHIGPSAREPATAI